MAFAKGHLGAMAGHLSKAEDGTRITGAHAGLSIGRGRSLGRKGLEKLISIDFALSAKFLVGEQTFQDVLIYLRKRIKKAIPFFFFWPALESHYL